MADELMRAYESFLPSVHLLEIRLRIAKLALAIPQKSERFQAR